VKLQQYIDDFYTFTGKASDLNRQLAFAGIAIIWLFKKDVMAGLTIPHELLGPSLLIVLSLALDMAHYCIASIIWRIFYRSREKLGISVDKEVAQPGVWWERPIWIVFCLKIVAVLIAYVWIGQFLISAILLR
jgi:hypothetical protein